ncbi:MAG: glycosyltransferase, partial [Thermoplasmata archaeon]
VLGLLVAYHPGRELHEAVAAALPQVGSLMVWDNSESSDATDALLGELERGRPDLPLARLRRSGTGRNAGLSAAYQQGFELAQKERFDSLLLLDQDSILAPGAVQELAGVLAELASRFRVGAVNASNRERVPLGLSPKTPLRRLVESHYEGEYRTGRLYRDGRVRERRTLINSGLLLPVPALREAGGFDTDLFLDAVDYDLALRLRTRGYRIFEALRAEVLHQQGVPTRVRLPGGPRLVRGYPPERTYHLVHDTTVCALRRRSSDRATAGAILGSMWLGSAGALLLLPDRSARLSAVVRGLSDAGRTLRAHGSSSMGPSPPMPSGG